ncbi:transporter, major facilitator family [Clostridium sp. D5]|nr:transporter, major facilitator family [Clostridium sp. D5]
MKQSVRNIEIRYAAVHSFFCMAYCSICGFATVYLAARQFSASEIGVLLAIANVLTIILQPVLAAYIDGAGKISLKTAILFLCLVTIALLSYLYTVNENKTKIAVVMLLATISILLMQPLLNSIYTYYMEKGIELNFGAARGTGSVTYAVISILLGRIIEHRGENSIVVTGILLYAGLLVFTLTFHIEKTPPRERNGERNFWNSMKLFVKKYKVFLLTLSGFVLIFTEHYIVNTFLLQIMENVGGGAGDVGTSLGIAAVCELPVMFGFSWIVRRSGGSQLLKVTAVAFTVKAVFFLAAPTVGMIHLAQCFQMLAYGLFMPAIVWYTSEAVDMEDMVKGQSLAVMCALSGNVLGNILGGWIYDSLGAKAMLLAGTVISAAGMIIILLIKTKNGGYKNGA